MKLANYVLNEEPRHVTDNGDGVKVEMDPKLLKVVNELTDKLKNTKGRMERFLVGAELARAMCDALESSRHYKVTKK